MKITTTTFFKHKTYIFSFFALISAGIFCSLPAYSQIDYSYGINKKGLRIGLGAGAASLKDYWGDQPLGPAGILTIDYNLSPYFSIGLDNQFGILVGNDNQAHYAFLKSTNTYAASNFNMKFGLGLISDFPSTNGFSDAIKRLYLGFGAGIVYSSVILKDRTDGLVVPSDGEVLLAKYSATSNTRVGTFVCFPLNFGTNIDLPGVLGNDRLELNPNFQYTLVASKVFDGYQPNSQSNNGAYALLSLSLKYKF